MKYVLSKCQILKYSIWNFVAHKFVILGSFWTGTQTSGVFFLHLFRELFRKDFT